MILREQNELLEMPSHIFEDYKMNSIAYFDIETTGFDKDEDKIILISLGTFIENGVYRIKQYFSEDPNEEGEVLKSFANDLKVYDKWCSYNGIAFDEPFIKRRMELNSIEFSEPEEHIDLYRLIRPFHKQLGMERCNLKTVEKHLGVKRTDIIDGGISVQLYYDFLETGDEKVMKTILLHNYEDVQYLPNIFELVNKVRCNPQFVRDDCITEKQLKFLKSLIRKNSIELDCSIERISKKTASRLIDNILKGNIDGIELKNIIASSY